MPKIIVTSGTATGMGRAAVGRLAAEGNPMRTSSAASGAIAIVCPVGERNGARSRLQGPCQGLLPGHLVSQDRHAPGAGRPEPESVSGVVPSAHSPVRGW
jgi:NAD(P)-dependent dehydrogenase (short-subunit alcohol dehydrogenase family)